MEVLTTTGRPRFIPSERERLTGGTGTMTRSSAISHNQHKHSPPGLNSNGLSSPTSSTADTTIRDKTKLLQLAEKVHTRKSAAPNYAKSFRAITSVVSSRSGSNIKDEGLAPTSTPTVRRTNSTMLSSSSSSAPPPSRPPKLENYKNPKLYASFSSKSSSKLTKALIRSDPAKTNIEHLVNYKNSPPKSELGNGAVSHNNSVNAVGKKSPSENGEHGGGGGGGLSSFITPLKALHASFHERSSKLGQTRSKLFSHHHHQREISGSNAKLLFGTQENLHSSSGGGSSSSSAEDILAAEIISQSKHGRGNHSNKNSSSPHRRTIITAANNSKNVASLSLLSPSGGLATRGQLQNGSSSGSQVAPDFLEGFRNEKSCKIPHQTNGHQSHHATKNHTNGLDKKALVDTPRRNGHEHEISQSNGTSNPFITPDILGGCFDVPHLSSVEVMRNGCNSNTSRPSYYDPPPSENDCKLRDDLRHLNGTNNNGLVVVTNGQSSINRNVSQKRKNILVRMSLDADRDDLYRDENRDVFDGGADVNINGDEGSGGQQVEGIWPTSPMMVSTVTPKCRQSVSVNNYCGEDILPVPTFSSFLASDSNSISKGNGPYSGGNSLRTFQPKSISSSNGSNSNGKSRIVPPPRTTSVLSTVSNSSGLLKSSSEMLSRNNLGGEAREQQLGARHSSKEGQAEHRNDVAEPQQIVDSPEAAGSLSWLQIKSSSAAEGAVNCVNGKAENDINSKAFNFSGNGVGIKKQVLRRAAALSPSSSAPVSSLNRSDNYIRCNGNRVNGDECENNKTDEFAMINDENGEQGPRPTAEGGGRSRRGMFMEAETSFAATQTRIGKCDRPQTALLSDEYAQYLGYDYDNDHDRKVQQAQTRLHVLQLGNKVISPTLTEEENSCAGEQSENDDVFDDERCGEKNMTMLAITTTSPSRYGSKIKNPTSIMKPQQGKRHENGKRIIQHSVSFRGTIDSPESKKPLVNGYRNDYGNCGRLSKLECSQSFSKFDRKRSSSLPKSFMSVRNGLRNVLPSQWVRDELAFERLNDHPDNSCPEEERPASSVISTDNQQLEESSAADEAFKMRWHKLGSSSSSFSDRRPKSFDYAQRKAWMKLYRDMEVSQASGSSSPSGGRPTRSLTKGSITHLHLQEPSSQGACSHVESGGDPCGCECEGDDTGSHSAMMRSSADISSTSPSLFKRFSKTFSLRFGSGSNVSKHPAGGEMHRKGKSSKGAIGSSPDLFNSRLEVDVSRDKVNGKMRKTNVKSVRGDKCQSGDSGIGMDEQHTEPHRQISNLRRIRSDYISQTAASSVIGNSQGGPTYTSRAQANSSTLAKLSLVEIPDHSWDEHNSSSSPNGGSGTSDTASYEELVDAKLDGDDGFSSGDEGHHHHQDQNPAYYHSLPNRKSNKRRLKEQGSTNSCGDNPQEDNSIRGKVVREIIHTEQNYVKTLNDIVQGFLNPCRARNDLFSSRTVQNIFSNIEEILRLHVKFLEALKSKVDPTFVSKSNVGGVFTSWAERFSLYSEYCCNNPISVATVRSLVQFPQYAEFFEACRRLQMMDKLPLHGFLLRPIQRICQYHLQLNELLKHTEESHTDHQSVVEALETMKSVATKINDTQRQFESLQEIIRFQNSIDGWEGPNLVDRNSVILRKGELVKVTHGRKPKEIFVAVLNKDLIYCKKDFMKKSGYVFDGRIDLNLRMWINIDSNEEDEFFGMVHNSWRIYSPERRAWILFTAPSPTEKRKWISALEKAKEDIVVDPKLREMAVVTTALAESEIMSNGNSNGHHSNTLPKSSKKSKGKHLTVTKVDSDAMLIEVGKLKRTTIHTNSNPSHREGTSKFYV